MLYFLTEENRLPRFYVWAIQPKQTNQKIKGHNDSREVAKYVKINSLIFKHFFFSFFSEKFQIFKFLNIESTIQIIFGPMDGNIVLLNK